MSRTPPVTLTDLSLPKLRRLLRDAERAAGPQSGSTAAIRRAIAVVEARKPPVAPQGEEAADAR